MKSMEKVLAKEQIRSLRKWVKGLESGRYRQGEGALLKVTPKGSHDFCCLGVAVCLMGGTYEVPATLSKGLSNTATMFFRDTFNKTGIPLSIWESEYGLTRHFMGDLMEMNDSKGYSFKRIAKEIRKHVLEEHGVKL